MKNYLKTLIFIFSAAALTSCTEETDTVMPERYDAIFSESFNRPEGEPIFDFATENWTRFSEAGTKQWFRGTYQETVYLEFSSFGSGESSNIGWVISPAINLDTITDPPIKKRLAFRSAQHHAVSSDNTFDLLVSTDFDGTDVLAAHWTVLPFNKPSYTGATNYDFVNSGGVDLSAYSGTIHIAFRVKGAGTFNSPLAGGFQIDNINIF